MKYSANIYKDFVKLFVPILIVFFLLFLTNIIDTFFASKISVKALAAMQAIFPLFFFLLSINEGFSTATNNLISIALGEKNDKKKNIYFTIWVMLALVVGIILFCLADNFVFFLLGLMNLSKEVFKLAFDYMDILFKFSFFYFLVGIGWAVLISFHKRKWIIFFWVLNVVLNTLLNYIFVFKFDLGVKGLALWTGIMWVIFNIIFFLKFVFLDKLVFFDFSFIKTDRKLYLKKYLSYFFSAFLSLQVFVWEFLINNYFTSLVGDKALAAYWVCSRLVEIVLNPFFAGWVSFVTMLWYWRWAKDHKMLEKLIFSIRKILYIYVLVSAVILFFFFKYLVLFFTDDSLVFYYSQIYLQIFAVFMIFFWINYFYSQIFQVTGFHRYRIFTNIMLVILIWFFEYLFCKYLGLQFRNIWLGWLSAQIVMAVVVWVLYETKVKKVLYSNLD